jgi:peptide/nickel transport system substrate-binding protein
MSSQCSQTGKKERKPGSTTVAGRVSRRNFTKLVAVSAGTAGFMPGMAAATGASLGMPSVHRSAYQTIPTGGTVTVAQAGDFDSLDPHHSTNFAVWKQIFDPLVALSNDNTYEGILAESWEISEDGLEYTFHLRDGIQFHNGEAMNADAVKFTYDRLMDPATAATGAGWLPALKETVVIDPLTVKLVLSEPFSPLLGNLTLSYFGILPPGATQELGDDFGKNPVGTGPWIFKEWIASESITLTRNPNYRNFWSVVENKGAPYFDELVFRNILEADTQIAALETGDVDIVTLPAREVQRFQGDSHYQVYLSPNNTIQYVEFEMAKPETADQVLAEFEPPFDDLRLRQAVGYAIDADDMLENVLFGQAVRNYGLVASNLFAFKPEIEEFGFHYDPAKAAALLDEAGWVDSDGDGVREKDGAGLEVTFSARSDSNSEKIGQVLQNQLSQVGFSVNLQTFEPASFIPNIAGGSSNLDLANVSWPEPHILYMLTSLLDWQFGRYHDADYLSLLEQAMKTTDLTERTELYFEASKNVLANAAMIPLWSPLQPICVRGAVKGFKPGPQGYGIYEDIYIEN